MEYQACNNVPLIGLCGNLLQKGMCDDCVLQFGLPQWLKRGCARKENSYVKVLLVYVSALSAMEARQWKGFSSSTVKLSVCSKFSI